MDLIERNLILVCKLGSSGKIKTCNIHDLLRDLCLRVAEKEKFLRVMRALDIPGGTDRERRIVLPKSIPNLEHLPEEDYQHQVFRALQPASLTRSLIFEGDQLPFTFRLLRVLSVVDGDSSEVLQRVNLRYLACEYLCIWDDKIPYELPSSVSLLWNLQTLIIGGSSKRTVGPLEIWYMSQLRHMELDLIWLPDPPPSDQQDDLVSLNLQTIENNGF